MFQNQDKSSIDLPRMVNVDFQIKDSTLSHTYDLVCFSEHVDGLFRLYMDGNTRETYFGPYFCFVQSSGMGQTKILWEYKELIMQNAAGVDAFLILPKKTPIIGKESEEEVFDYHLDLDSVVPKVEPDPANTKQTEEQQTEMRRQRGAVALEIYRQLDAMLLKLKEQRGKATYEKIVLIFDESQRLLDDEFGMEAFRFRCVLIWLREVRRSCTVVAVFTGTNSKLTNFLFETDMELKRSNTQESSREMKNADVAYFEKGSELYPPFFRTMTMGSCRYLLKEMLDEPHTQTNLNATNSEYKRAVYYGRPLFAQMAKENKLEENLQTVLFRMVRNHTWSLGKDEDRTKEFATWINLLSTRIQLGQTTADVSSELVANSYANFCGYNPGSRSVLLGFLPDPECARLAMCLMDDTFAHNVTIRSDLLTIKGENKTWWTGTMKKIFSSGIVTPDKGDFGEVVVALYTLFCGDVLRMQINEQNMEKQTLLERNEVNMIQNYTQFSVPLDNWLHLMMSGGIFSDEPETTVTTNCKVTVGFLSSLSK